MENADTTGDTEASAEDTDAAHRTEKGRALWPSVAIFIHKSMWRHQSSHRTSGRKGRLLKESTEKDSGLPDGTESKYVS